MRATETKLIYTWDVNADGLCFGHQALSYCRGIN